jgi:hypothetical protein
MFTRRREGIAHVEAAHAPRLGGRAVFDGNPRLSHLGENLVEIVDLDRQIRHVCARTALRGKADLSHGLGVAGESHDPAVVHGDIHAEDIAIE